MNITNTLVLTKKELKVYFNSPIAYIVAAIFLIVGGVLFWPSFFLQNQADLRNYLMMLPWLLTFIIPAITMRSFAEEKNTGSYELLATLPLKLKEVVIGKYLAAAILVSLMLLFILVYGVSIELVGDLDWGPIWGGFIGAVFLSSTYVAIGIFSSSLTNNQIVSFIIALSINLFIFLIDKFLLFLPSALVDFFSFFSSDRHFSNFAKGVIDSRDVYFFVLVTFLFLLGTLNNLKQDAIKKK